MKKCVSGCGTVDATMPFRNSAACEPVTDNTALFGTFAIVGVVRTSARRAGGNMAVVE